MGHAALLMKFQHNPSSGLFKIYKSNNDFKKAISVLSKTKDP